MHVIKPLKTVHQPSFDLFCVTFPGYSNLKQAVAVLTDWSVSVLFLCNCFENLSVCVENENVKVALRCGCKGRICLCPHLYECERHLHN